MEQAGFGVTSVKCRAIVFEKMGSGFLPGGETFEAPTVDEKNSKQPSWSNRKKATPQPVFFQEVLVLVLAAVMFWRSGRFARDVQKGNAEHRVAGAAAAVRGAARSEKGMRASTSSGAPRRALSRAGARARSG